MKKLFYIKTLITFAVRIIFNRKHNQCKQPYLNLQSKNKLGYNRTDSHRFILLNITLAVAKLRGLSVYRWKMLLTVPIKIINECRDEAQLKQLADFIFIKTLYKNSCIYNASQSNLSRKTGFSRTKITKLLKTFKKNGWVRYHHNNLIFAWDKSKYGVFATINFITQQDILNQLQLFILRNKRSQCLYANKLRKDLNPSGYISLKDYKKAVKHDRERHYKGAICDDFVLSTKGAARLFNCSTSSANRILLNLEKQGLIFIKRVRRFVQFCSKEMFEYFKRPKGAVGSYYWHNGKVYQSMPSVLTIPSHPEQVLTKIKQAA